MKEILKFDEFEFEVDSNRLQFDETSLDDYLKKEASYIDHYGGALAYAERNLQNKKGMFDKVYGERFIEAKNEGSSDKMAEHKSRTDPVVCDITKEIIQAQFIVNRLKNHLKAWDRNHDNAQSVGHMLRKQLDKLNNDIYFSSNSPILRDKSSLPKQIEKVIEETASDEFGFSASFNL